MDLEIDDVSTLLTISRTLRGFQSYIDNKLLFVNWTYSRHDINAEYIFSKLDDRVLYFIRNVFPEIDDGLSYVIWVCDDDGFVSNIFTPELHKQLSIYYPEALI